MKTICRRLFIYITVVLLVYFSFTSACSTNDTWISNNQSLVQEIFLGEEIILPIKSPNGLAYNNRFLWTADYKSKKPGAIVAFDLLLKKKQASKPVLPHMEGLTWDGKDFWVGAPKRKISRLDGKTFSLIETFKSPTREDADGLAWDGSHLWIASHYHGWRNAQLVKIDRNSKRILQSHELPFKEVGDITYYNNTLWVVKFGHPKHPDDKPAILSIDPASGKILQIYTADDLPRKIWGITHAEDELWVCSAADDKSPPRLIKLLFDRETP